MERTGGLAGAPHGSRVSAVLSPCLHIVVHVPENMWQRPQTVVALTSPSRPALPPDPELGSRRQSKVKYIYRLLREKDVGESLEGKTVRVAAAPPPAAAPLLRPCLRFPLGPCNTGTRQSGARQPSGSSSAAAVCRTGQQWQQHRCCCIVLEQQHQKGEVGMEPDCACLCSSCHASTGCQLGPCPCCAALQPSVQVYVLWPDDGTWYKGHVEECDVAAKKASSCTANAPLAVELKGALGPGAVPLTLMPS